MASNNKNKNIEEIAKLYYEEGYTQIEISKRLGISRPSVSNKLNEAKRLGIVKIFVNSSGDQKHELESRLQSALNVNTLHIVSTPKDNPDLAFDITVREGAEQFTKQLEPTDCLGVSWGHTIRSLSKYIVSNSAQVDTIVQCVGSIADITDNASPDGMIRELAIKLNAKKGYTLSTPAIVGNPLIVNSLLFDKNIKQTLDNIKRCNKIFVNIALPDESTCLFQQGYLSRGDLDELKRQKAVGSICNRFYNADGEALSGEIDDRTLGIQIKELIDAECVMCCVTGARKAYAVYCAAKAGFLDYLIIDSQMAEKMIEFIE